MKIYDVSMKLEEGMVCYPKDVPYTRRKERDQTKGDSSTTSDISMSAHTGTHIDAPVHFIAGSWGVDSIAPEVLYGPAVVVDCRGSRSVSKAMLEDNVPAGVMRVLMKTDNSQRLNDDPKGAFRTDYVYLETEAAGWLVEQGVRLVGIDYLNVEQYGSKDKMTHKTLLGNEVVIIEGLNLAGVEAGEYFMCCGPLKLADSDGAPCRVVLIEGL